MAFIQTGRQNRGTDRKQNLGQVFRQDRENPVLLENLSQDLFPVFSPFLPSLSEIQPCLDLELRNHKPVRRPVF